MKFRNGLSIKNRSKIKSNTETYRRIQETNAANNIVTFPRLQEGKQALFGAVDADVIIFGGAAGSGKSHALLVDFARQEFIDNLDYRAVIFRRTYPEFTQAGGLVDESRKIYQPIKGSFAEKPNLEWRFASGSRISFRHLQHEKTVYSYQGAQIARIGFDELTHFTEDQFFYLLSRNRSVSGIKPAVRATCNPDADSWVADFISWWIDPRTGYAIEERAGVVRYFVREGNTVHWADTRDELIEKFDLKNKLFEMIPPDIREEFLADDDVKIKPEDLVKSFTFIPATIFDNRALIKVNPTYLANLYALHPIERERLLKGNWKVKYEAGTVFDRTWFEILDSIPDDWKLIGKVRFWDLAATAKENAENYHCYTSGTLVYKYERIKTVLSDGKEVREFVYVVADNLCEQKKVGEVELMLKNTAGIDGKTVAVRWEQEGGSSGKFVENTITNVIREYHPNHDVAAIAPQGDKLTRALPAATAASRGQIFLLRDSVWNNRFLNACQNFDGNKKTPPVNDIVDSLSGAFYSLENEFLGHDDDGVMPIASPVPVNKFRDGLSRGRGR
jgi:predicted phage terminase large subunit-like protein